MHLIVGLGNPTKQYEGTRHNVGFETIDRIAAENQIRVEEKKHKALYGSGYIEGEKVILAKPQTFMNLSGESVRELSDYYKIPAENIIVIYDDISLDVGQLRIREKGSAGGQCPWLGGVQRHLRPVLRRPVCGGVSGGKNSGLCPELVAQRPFLRCHARRVAERCSVCGLHKYESLTCTFPPADGTS